MGSILRVWAFWIPRKERPENDRSAIYPCDTKGLCTISYASVNVSRPVLVTIPPQAHMNPHIASRGLIVGPTSKLPLEGMDSDSIHTFGSDTTFHGGETIQTLTPTIAGISSVTVMDSPALEKDVYGWERSAITAGLARV
ncbi:hypothetical protein FRB97_009121 [Tulasnella sp. 331]|nr:hypothetical protein FRB97_009121 [Tulasnella sp. 331]KAG8887781.1 hypothetical protein FRB98_009041 [Tulasnella sp. 332]